MRGGPPGSLTWWMAARSVHKFGRPSLWPRQRIGRPASHDAAASLNVTSPGVASPAESWQRSRRQQGDIAATRSVSDLSALPVANASVDKIFNFTRYTLSYLSNMFSIAPSMGCVYNSNYQSNNAITPRVAAISPCWARERCHRGAAATGETRGRRHVQRCGGIVACWPSSSLARPS